MPLNPITLHSMILDELAREMPGKDVDMLKSKLAKAIATAIVKHIQAELIDTKGNKHF